MAGSLQINFLKEKKKPTRDIFITVNIFQEDEDRDPGILREIICQILPSCQVSILGGL